METEALTNQPKHGPIPAGIRLRCIHCDYELTGLTARVCPECGEPFDIEETLRINQRQSWKYLMENRCTSGAYPFFQLMRLIGVPPKAMEWILWGVGCLFQAVLVSLAVTFIMLSLYKPFALIAFALVLPAELFIAFTDRGKTWLRLIVWTLCVLLALVI